jgi:hypothetical protein
MQNANSIAPAAQEQPETETQEPSLPISAGGSQPDQSGVTAALTIEDMDAADDGAMAAQELEADNDLDAAYAALKTLGLTDRVLHSVFGIESPDGRKQRREMREKARNERRREKPAAVEVSKPKTKNRAGARATQTNQGG